MSTVPESSRPGVKGTGGRSWYRPWHIRMSAKLRPAAATSITTSPGPGSGSGRVTTASTSAGSPFAVTVQACTAATRYWGRTIARERRSRLDLSLALGAASAPDALHFTTASPFVRIRAYVHPETR